MSAQDRLSRLTGFLYALTIVMFAGTILELIAAKHFQEPIQVVPFVLCVAGIFSVFLAWRRPDRRIILGLRALMVLTTAGTLLGIWEHIEGNMGFILEMHPGTSGWPLISGALTGRAPLLASGVLAASATIAIAATFAAGWDLAAVDRPDALPAPGQQVSTIS
jgi:hypothetical protein